MPHSLVYGLDLGINNVGWAAVRKGDHEIEILAMGTYVFNSPLKDENDPAEGLKSRVRGEKRRARRTGRRRHHRKMDLYRTLAAHGLLPAGMHDRVALFCGEPNPYLLRAKGLSERLEPFEFGRVLCHLNQRRGFLSPRDLMFKGSVMIEDDDVPEEDDNGSRDEETGVVLSEVKRTREAVKEFESIGAFLFDRLQKGEPVRKKKLKDAKPADQRREDQRRFVRADRHMIRAEFDKLWQRQAVYHPILTNSLKARVEEIMFQQRLLQADMSTRGSCTFLPKEWRMPRASLTAQKFVLAQDVAHLEVKESDNAAFRKLTESERKALVEKLMEGGEAGWVEIKNLLGLSSLAQFNIEPIKYKNAAGKTVTLKTGKKDKLRGSQTVSRIQRIIGTEKWKALGEQAQRELVGEIVSIRDWTTDDPTRPPAAFRRRQLFQTKAYGPNRVVFNEKEANELATVQLPEGYLSISLKAAKRIMHHLLKDCVYSEACEKAGFNHANPEGEQEILDRLPYPTEKEIPHAVVRASVRSAVRVLNALHKEFGKPDSIRIELPRDLAKGAKQREEDEKRIKENERVRKEITKRLVAIGVRPTRDAIRKVQLWEELGGAGLAMEPDVVVHDLKELMTGPYDVCHIVPRGHNLDNSMGNLFLGTVHFNREVQGNRTPYETFADSPDQWRRITAHVNSLKGMDWRKRNRLLAKERPEDFTGRHLAATGWISSAVLKLAQRMVPEKHNVLVVPGRATSEFRKVWGIDDLIDLHPVEVEAKKAWEAFEERAEAGEATEEDVDKIKPPTNKTRSNFKHHALDALVVALTERATLQALAEYEQLRDQNDPRFLDRERRRHERTRAMPDPDIRSKARAALENAKVVHRPSRRPTGELHKQMPEKNVVQKMPNGEPWGSQVIGKHLVKFDGDGRPAQAYPLGSNHHCVIWERTTPNKKGQYERCAEVVPTIEAVRRRNAKEPVIRKTHPEPGWRFVMALVKGDTVEMRDGTIAVVSKFYAPSDGKANITLWHPYVAGQLGKINAENPYLVRNLSILSEIGARIVMKPLGEIVYREGGTG
jgi:CRISPR-associated endonuclease Csn1